MLSSAGRRPTALVCAVIACALLPSPAPAADPPDDYPRPFRYCGHFKSDYTIHVYAKKVRCRKAKAIQREYWNGRRRDRKIVNGGTGASGYVVLDKYPRWVCTSGSGGGGCSKGKRTAAYAN